MTKKPVTLQEAKRTLVERARERGETEAEGDFNIAGKGECRVATRYLFGVGRWSSPTVRRLGKSQDAVRAYDGILPV